MDNLFTRPKFIYTVITSALLAAMVFFVCRIVVTGLVTIQYPQSINDSANVLLTESFINKLSPYTTSSLERYAPDINYDLPFFNSVLAYLINANFGTAAVNAHFIISVLSILTTGYIGYITIGDHSKGKMLPLLASLLLMLCHYKGGFISPAPDDLGLLLFIFAGYIVTAKGVKNKPLWAAIIITLCFYTRQYFAFAAIPVLFYLILTSFGDAMGFFLWLTAINAFTALLVIWQWPLFFIRAFILRYLGIELAGGMNVGAHITAVKILVIAMVVILIMFAILMKISPSRFTPVKDRLTTYIKKDDPLSYGITCIATLIIPLIFLICTDGIYSGSSFTYALQLLGPAVVITAVSYMDKIGEEGKQRIYVFAAVSLAAMILSLILPEHFLTARERDAWNKASSNLAVYDREGEVYYAPILGYERLDKEDGDCPCAAEAEIGEHTVPMLEASGISADNMDMITKLVDQNMAYRDVLREMTAEHAYSLISIDADALDDAKEIISAEACEENGYTCIDSISLRVGNKLHEVLFYAVKQ